MTLMNERYGKQREKEADSSSSGNMSVAARFQVAERSTAAVSLPAAAPNASSDSRPLHKLTIGSQTLLLPAPQPPGPLFHVSKRAGDVTVAATLLLILFLPLMLVAILIYLEDGGPIFYYQMRVGKDGKPFRFYKFRSMVRNADALKAELEKRNEASGPIFKIENDPRVTRIGRVIRRYSVDEMPQLMNVLRGEMSLIGPRPHLPSEIEKYPEYPMARLRVQPGLLCFREVYGRSKMTFEEWLELDLLYIQYRSVKTDLRILLRTIPAVLKGDGAY